jgi:hypothetical protein
MALSRVAEAQPLGRGGIAMPPSAGKRAAGGLTLAIAAAAVLLGAPAAASARAGDAVLLAAGDIGNCAPAAERGPYLTADLLAVRPEATILALGDLAYKIARLGR